MTMTANPRRSEFLSAAIPTCSVLRARGRKIISVTGLLAMLVVGAAGCGAIRQGDERISYAVIPFIGTAVKVESFKPGTDEIDSAMEMFAAGSGFDIKKYGEGMQYEGMYKIRINLIGDIKVTTEVYDEKNKLVKKVDGVPDDVPIQMRDKMNVD